MGILDVIKRWFGGGAKPAPVKTAPAARTPAPPPRTASPAPSESAPAPAPAPKLSAHEALDAIAASRAAAKSGSFVERRERPRVNARDGTRVLIIDDSPTIVALLKRMLEQNGYKALEAVDAETGVAMATSDAPDLIFLDIVLPGMNGFEALRRLRRDPATKTVPIVMISGNELATEQFYAQRIGADDFMKKPFSRSEVFARIERLLDVEKVPRRHLAAVKPLPTAEGATFDATATPAPASRPAAAPAPAAPAAPAAVPVAAAADETTSSAAVAEAAVAAAPPAAATEAAVAAAPPTAATEAAVESDANAPASAPTPAVEPEPEAAASSVEASPPVAMPETPVAEAAPLETSGDAPVSDVPVAAAEPAADVVAGEPEAPAAPDAVSAADQASVPAVPQASEAQADGAPADATAAPEAPVVPDAAKTMIIEETLRAPANDAGDAPLPMAAVASVASPVITDAVAAPIAVGIAQGPAASGIATHHAASN